jgi:predicted RNase H-like nuclease (RuvC/YqgF family)
MVMDNILEKELRRQIRAKDKTIKELERQVRKQHTEISFLLDEATGLKRQLRQGTTQVPATQPKSYSVITDPVRKIDLD